MYVPDHMHQSCHASECVMSHEWMTHLNASRYASEHVIYTNECFKSHVNVRRWYLCKCYLCKHHLCEHHLCKCHLCQRMCKCVYLHKWYLHNWCLHKWHLHTWRLHNWMHQVLEHIISVQALGAFNYYTNNLFNCYTNNSFNCYTNNSIVTQISAPSAI